ncbi:MAG: phosphorylase [Elusimicrobia bacterium]|nr:phosphorylase [Elusimicrobiota bacterium]
MRNVLVAAATRWESEPIRRALSRPALVLRTGLGPAAASAALARLETEPALVVSAGFAGALQPDLRCGDLVACQLTPCPQAAKALETSAVGLGVVPRFGRILHSDFVLTTPEQKREAGERSGALAVDMESSAIAAWARGRGLPALAVRVVFDELDRPLPAAGWAMLNPFFWPRLAAFWPVQRRAAAVLSSVMRSFLEAL